MVVEIEGNIYDTHNAERLTKYEEGTIGNWWWIFKALYKTLNGKYFTYETGGCGTEYHVWDGKKFIGGIYQIHKATDEQARVFLEQNNPTLALILFKNFYEKEK